MAAFLPGRFLTGIGLRCRYISLARFNVHTAGDLGGFNAPVFIMIFDGRLHQIVLADFQFLRTGLPVKQVTLIVNQFMAGGEHQNQCSNDGYPDTVASG